VRTHPLEWGAAVGMDGDCPWELVGLRTLIHGRGSQVWGGALEGLPKCH
jgi:hypothetical protein